MISKFTLLKEINYTLHFKILNSLISLLKYLFGPKSTCFIEFFIDKKCTSNVEGGLFSIIIFCTRTGYIM